MTVKHKSRKASFSAYCAPPRLASPRLASAGFTIVELLIVIVVIAILAAITLVAFNGVTQKAKDAARVSDLSQWKSKSEIRKIETNMTCPDNYVFVYGNATFGTSDFCVMKYEAANVGGVATSQASGTPWTTISQTTAITTAGAIPGCTSCHLLTEAEWMTLAADVLSVKYNWSGGAVGSGFIYSGHNDNVPAGALAASTDDTDGYNGTGNSDTNSPNQRRTLYLTSGEVIWDLAGNVYEWTTGSITGAQPGLATDSATPSNFSSKEWNSASMNWNSFALSSRASAVAPVPGLASIASWGSAQGIGQLNSNQNQTGARAFIRGGASNSGSLSGVLTLNLSNASTGTSPNIGFRVAK